MKGTENENFIFISPENTTLCPLTKASMSIHLRSSIITHTDFITKLQQKTKQNIKK